jgi:hypothetical protein
LPLLLRLDVFTTLLNKLRPVRKPLPFFIEIIECTLFIDIKVNIIIDTHKKKVRKKGCDKRLGEIYTVSNDEKIKAEKNMPHKNMTPRTSD